MTAPETPTFTRAPATEDLFTPIHKAIRSMIFDLAGRLQTADFADVARSKALLADLEHEFSVALSAGCILCLLHRHAADEEEAVFPAVAEFDSNLVRGFIEEHHDIARRLEGITRMSKDVATLARPEERIDFGAALTRTANDFFTFYLAHLNREEAELVPFMRAHFTDEQMRSMRGAIMGGMPRDRMITIFRWMLPSLNVTELTALLRGIQREAPPTLFQLISGIAAERVDPDRWQTVKARVGL